MADLSSGSSGGAFEAGARGRRLVARLLGLDRSGARFVVARVRWSEGRLEVAVRSARGETVDLVLEEARGAEQRRPFLSAGRVDLWYRGRLPAGLEDLLRAFAARPPRATLAELVARLRATPGNVDFAAEPGGGDSGAAAGGGQAGSTSAARARAGGEGDAAPPPRPGTWDEPGAFADFLGLDLLALMPYEAIESVNPLVRVSHSDLECLSFMPREGPSNMNLVDFPWIVGEEGRIKRLETVLCTDLTEQAVIMGCNARARAALDHALAVAPGRPIVFTNACLPATTAEDVMSVLRRYRERAPVALVSHNRAAPDRDDDMPAVLLAGRRRARRPARRRGSGLVNLIGYPPGPALAELEALLAAIGLRVNAAVLPVVREEDVARLPRASWNVFHCGNPFWERAYARLTAHLSLPALRPPHPYGVAGTRSWLTAIAEATGRRERVGPAWAARFAPWHGEWRRLAAEAREFAVGIVLRPSDVAAVEEAGRTNGIPLLAALAEIGFGLAVWIHAAGEEAARLGARVLAAIPPADRRRCTVQPFADLDGLRRVLRDSPARAVVSNYAFDWRLTEAGKNRISFRHFEPGVEGAVRTARRLLDVCRVPFAARYARFLARDELGRRSAPVGGGQA